MNTQPKFNIDFSKKLPLVGRETEINIFNTCVEDYNSSDFLYFIALGGIGKTRLLEEFQEIVLHKGDEYRCTGLIDLFHTDIHSTSDIERSIVENIDQKKEFFKSYREKRLQYELWRERGTDPGILEKRREEISETFVREWNDMARKFHKLVIVFDTLENLQYESSIVEDKAGLDTVEARVKPWILNKLSKLVNVLVVFAGRPKPKPKDALVDHQSKLENEMRSAFGASLQILPLLPLSTQETTKFINLLSRKETIIPPDLVPVIRCLTGGRPIFIHLIFDLIRHLHIKPDEVLQDFYQYKDLVCLPEESTELIKVRESIQKNLVSAIFKREPGAFLLCRIGMMPKGVTIEILHEALGIPEIDVETLFESLTPLSFIKSFHAPEGGERLHQNWIFLHDEMYRLMRLEGVINDLRLNECFVARALVTNYYNPKIRSLELEIQNSVAEKRVVLRERLQKTQVERMYYILVQNPDEGWQEYKRLSHEANLYRWVGFGMRLLDEFIRFYNDDERRALFSTFGVSHEQVVRESAELWVERFRWWGQSERAVNLSRAILDKPEDFSIDSERDLGILANIYAMWGTSRIRRAGFEPKVVQEMKKILTQLPTIELSTEKELLARARLCYAIGNQYLRGGESKDAARYFGEAKSVFGILKKYPDELSIVLNGLAMIYGKMGQWVLAQALVKEAYQLNKELQNDYSMALALSTMAGIEGRHGNFAKSIEIANLALGLFQQLGDNWGIALVRQNLAFAKRRMAKSELDGVREIRDVIQKLKEAENDLQAALEAAAEIELLLPGLYVELGRIYRDMGRAFQKDNADERDIKSLHFKSRENLQKALGSKELDPLAKADAKQDLAEECFYAGLYEEAVRHLKNVEDLVQSKYLIIPGKQIPSIDLSGEFFLPLGKVERLRGEMDFAEKKYLDGLKHFCLAYAYFGRFSPSASEIEGMVQYIYGNLQKLELVQLKDLITTTKTWIQENNLGYDMAVFFENIHSLLGV